MVETTDQEQITMESIKSTLDRRIETDPYNQIHSALISAWMDATELLRTYRINHFEHYAFSGYLIDQARNIIASLLEESATIEEETKIHLVEQEIQLIWSFALHLMTFQVTAASNPVYRDAKALIPET